MSATKPGGKCGCVACKSGETKPNSAYSRGWWTGHTNKHGRGYGRGKKTGGK